MMKQLFGPIVVSLATVVLIMACRSDVVIEPPPSIVGDYTGVYIYKTGQGSGADSLVQAVRFTFRETGYNMAADTSSELYSDNVCFCVADGTYAITDRVRLVPRTDAAIPDNCQTCDPAQSPQGSYTLEQPTGGIKLTWVQTIDGEIITSQLILTRISS